MTAQRRPVVAARRGVRTGQTGPALRGQIYGRGMNPVALITGASRGIGRGIALELARLGYDLVLNYASNSTAAQQTSLACTSLAMTNDHNIRAEICLADIGTTEGRKRLLNFARSRFERLDLLVNNAGIAPETRADLLQSDEKSFDRLMDVNVKGPFFLTQQAALWMIELAAEQGPTAPKPKIINISSISACTASVDRGDYCVSKAALSMVLRRPISRKRSSPVASNCSSAEPN